ncbi:50S ribosomal protein L37ae [Candidatus Woesearchaeota archaeon]|nr:50S ribosomal protein L37ae [Candidatus Woesearchaeota archaeon]
MAMIRKVSSTKRFRVRYGRSNRDKLAAVEELHRGWHKCPYCSKEAVKRESAGIWKCYKCDAVFAGRAYSMAKRKTAAELLISEEQYEALAKETAAEVEAPEEETAPAKEA